VIFWAKRSLLCTVLATGLLAGGAWLLANWWNLDWAWDGWAKALAGAGIGLAVIVSSDAVVHFCLVGLFRHGYVSRLRALAEYFRPQSAMVMVLGGVMAGAEEMFFRGVILTALHETAHWSEMQAGAAAALLFGLAHTLPHRSLWIFGVWAVWEGALLSWIFLQTDSLAATALAHMIHDAAGFAVLRNARDTGRFLT